MEAPDEVDNEWPKKGKRSEIYGESFVEDLETAQYNFNFRC